MAGIPCKIAIDNALQAVQTSLLDTLRSDRAVELLGKEKRASLVQLMADLDTAHYRDLYDGVMCELEAVGLYSEDVFKILARPQ